MSAEIHKTIEVNTKIEVEPRELAKMFWDMDSSEQAEFFNELRDMAGAMLTVQMDAVRRNRSLNFEGEIAMKTMGGIE